MHQVEVGVGGYQRVNSRRGRNVRDKPTGEKAYSEELIFSSRSARQLGRENPELSNLGNTSDYLGSYILVGFRARQRRTNK